MSKHEKLIQTNAAAGHHIRLRVQFVETLKMAEVDIDLYADDLDQGFPLKVRFIERFKSQVDEI